MPGGRPRKARCDKCMHKSRRCRGPCANNEVVAPSTTTTTTTLPIVPSYFHRRDARSGKGTNNRASDRSKAKKNKVERKQAKERAKKREARKNQTRPKPSGGKEALNRLGVKAQNIPKVHDKFKGGQMQTSRRSQQQRFIKAGMKGLVGATLGGRSPSKEEFRDAVEGMTMFSSSSSSSSSTSRKRQRPTDTTLLDHIKKQFQNKSLTPTMKIVELSKVSKDYTKEQLEQVLGVDIHPRLFAAANRNALFPGPGVLDKTQPHHRMVISEERLENVMRVMLSSDSIHRRAFSASVFTLCNGDVETLPGLVRDGSIDRIFQNYYNGCLTELNLPENRCPKKHNRHLKGCQCLLEEDHESRCQFTPKHGISLSTTKRIMGRITPNAIKNLAGLDDTAVTKGYENFKRLKEVIAALAIHEPTMTLALARTLTEIVEVFEIYVKTDYLQQLELDSQCIHTCFRGSFTPAPTAAAVGAAAQAEEEEEKDEIPVEDLDYPTVDESNPLVFMGMDNHVENAFVFEDTDRGDNNEPQYFQFTGVDEDVNEGNVLYSWIKSRGRTKKTECNAFEDNGTVRGDTIKHLFFGDETNGGGIYTFIGRGESGVASAKAKYKEWLDSKKMDIEDSDGDSSSESSSESSSDSSSDSEDSDESDDEEIPSEIIDPGPGEKLECDHDHHLHLQQFVDMARVFAAVKTTAGTYHSRVADQDNQDAIDRSLEYKEASTEIKDTMDEYIGHLVRGKWEGKKRKERQENMSVGHGTMTSDWKMKILSEMFREPSKEWYAKRGISCIGFMIVQKIPDGFDPGLIGLLEVPESGLLVSFVDMITDDTKQDAYSVACAKLQVLRMLRDHPIPELRLTSVASEEDGAGCFSAMYGRNTSRLYAKWTFDEGTGRSIEISTLSFGEAQMNKSGLDSHFSYFALAISTGVGATKVDARDAHTIVDAVNAADLQSTQCWAYQPDRSEQNEDDFDKAHFNYGKPSFVENIDKEIDGTRYVGQRYRDYHLGPWSWASKEDLDDCWDGDIPMPRSIRDTRGEELHPRKLPREMKTETKKQKHQTKLTKKEQQGEVIKQAAAKRLHDQQTAGLFPCCQMDEHNNRCMRIFSSKTYLDSHNKNGETKDNCVFPTLSLMDRVTLLASDEAKMVALGSKVIAHNYTEESFAPVPKNQIKDSVPGFNHIFAGHSLGQCRKKKHRKRKNKLEPTCHEYLQKQYNAGVEDKRNRLPIGTVRTNMSQLRLRSNNNYVFSRREGNVHGQLPSESQMKSWFSTRTKDQGRNVLDPRFVFWKSHPVGQLRDLVGGDVAERKAPYLAQILYDREKVAGTDVGFVNGVYLD